MSSDDIKTRTRILNSALALMAEGRGYGVRMNDIAESAGISRQAVYLHFSNRTALLIATARHVDQVEGLHARLHEFRNAESGRASMAAYIAFWGGYLPEIYGVAKALMIAQATDKVAAAAWHDRVAALREGARTAIDKLHSEGMLAREWTPKPATDVFWTLLSIPNWEQLRFDCGYSTDQYIAWMQCLADRTFISSRGLSPSGC